MSDQLTPLERFLVVQSIYTKAAAAVSTKSPDNMRAEIDAAYRAEWERTGGKTYSMKFAGEPVATYSIAETKGEPPKESRVLDLVDPDAFAAWLEGEGGTVAARWFADTRAREFCEWYVGQTGELPAGVEPRTVRTRGKVGGQYKSASVRSLDADKVLAIATREGYLSASTVPLLGGGEDDR